VDYRDVLATVVGASVAGIIAFTLRLIFPINAAVLALIYAASYSLLWSIVGDHARLLFHKRLPASTRLDGHWRLVTGGIALTAALCAGLIVAFALSRPTFVANDTTGVVTSRLVTRTLALQQRVVVTKKTIILPVKTTIVTTPVTETTGSPVPSAGTNTIYSHTVVVERPPVTVTVSSTRSRTATVVQTQTQTTPTVTSAAPVVTTVVTTVETAPATETTVGATTETAPAP
jgi:hypothetical protein